MARPRMPPRRRSLDGFAPWTQLAAQFRDLFEEHSQATAAWRDSLRAEYAGRVDEAITVETWLDECAQTCACLIAVLHQEPRLVEARCATWLLEQADPLWRELLEIALAITGGVHVAELSGRGGWRNELRRAGEAACRAAETASPGGDERDPLWITHFYEQFLAAHNAKRRARFGVYYTPQPLVRFTVAMVNHLLRAEYQRPGGFASHGPLRVLDPAAGSGGFLVEALDQSREAGCGRTPLDSCDSNLTDRKLSHVLARLHGWERLLPAAAMAQLNVAAKLLDLDYSFSQSAALVVQLRNSLMAPPADALHGAAAHGELVVIGNPPFSGISRAKSPWIDQLMRGKDPHGLPSRSYFHIEGQSLGERKVWLNDDYVKFYRLGQWLLDRAGAGVLAYVSNHGFLDNVTFRAMRSSLLESFARLTIVDLHGNRKRHETAWNGRPDANLFGIEQGTAVAFLRKDRDPGRSPAPQLTVVDVWGTADEKNHWLAEQRRLADRSGEPLSGASGSCFQPAAPLFLFRPPSRRGSKTDLLRLPLNRVMPVHCTAPVTARDHFVVAFSRAELVERLRQFADLTIPDDEIRARYFRRTRSARYRAGDTRGWNLAEARRMMAATADHDASIIECQYRPFDVRPIFWTPWMIDWPRSALLEHLGLPGNWCLITRRQMLPGKPCNFFWATERIALDGIIRSDNRGSELLLPVFVRDAERPDKARPNFSDEFVELCARSTGLDWHTTDRPGSESCLGPERLAWYLYGLFQLFEYREHFAQQLWHGFPPVLVPATAEAFAALAAFGRRLLALQGVPFQLEPAPANPENGAPSSQDRSAADWLVGTPRFDGQRIWINQTTAIADARTEHWEFRVGAHQVCRKWLVDRRARILTSGERYAYRRLVATIGAMQSATREMATFVEDHGGWPRLFC